MFGIRCRLRYRVFRQSGKSCSFEIKTLFWLFSFLQKYQFPFRDDLINAQPSHGRADRLARCQNSPSGSAYLDYGGTEVANKLLGMAKQNLPTPNLVRPILTSPRRHPTPSPTCSKESCGPIKSALKTVAEALVAHSPRATVASTRRQTSRGSHVVYYRDDSLKNT